MPVASRAALLWRDFVIARPPRYKCPRNHAGAEQGSLRRPVARPRAPAAAPGRRGPAATRDRSLPAWSVIGRRAAGASARLTRHGSWDLLGLSEEKLCAALDADPLTLLSGQLEYRPELPVLLDLLGGRGARGPGRAE